MTLEQAVKLAREQGLEVEYRRRKDGGIRVTEINGRKYKGSEGNKVIRKKTHSAGLSSKRVKQLKKGRKIAKDTQKFNRLNKARKKLGKKEISKEDYKRARKKGEEKRMRQRMLNSIRRRLGFAGYANVQTFIERLAESKKVAIINGGEAHYFEIVSKWLNENIEYVTEDALTDCILILYDYMNGLLDGEMAESMMIGVLKKGKALIKDINIDFSKLKNGTGW